MWIGHRYLRHTLGHISLKGFGGCGMLIYFLCNAFVAGGRGNQPHSLRQPRDWLRIWRASRPSSGIVRRFLQPQVQQPGQLPKWCAKGWQRHSSVCSPNHHGWQVLRFDLPVWLWLRYLSCILVGWIKMKYGRCVLVVVVWPKIWFGFA